MMWKPRPDAGAPSACTWISSAAPTLPPNRPRSHTHGPHASRELTERVMRTVAPSAVSFARSRNDTFHANVASG